MCSPDRNLSRDTVELLEAADCINIDLRYGIKPFSIPKDLARRANLVWFSVSMDSEVEGSWTWHP